MSQYKKREITHKNDDLKQKTNIYLSGSGSTLFIIEPTIKTKQYINDKYQDLYQFKTKII